MCSDLTALQVLGTALLMYDGPSPPPGTFDMFLAIPAISNNVQTRSFTSFLNDVIGNTFFDGPFLCVVLLIYPV